MIVSPNFREEAGIHIFLITELNCSFFVNIWIKFYFYKPFETK